MKTEGRKWYLTLVAGVYLVLCSAACLYYVFLYFRPESPTVALHVQILCLGMALSSGLYFFNARAGHVGLLVLTALVILAIGNSDAKATAFHVGVLTVLVIPFVTRALNRSKNSANNEVERTS